MLAWDCCLQLAPAREAGCAACSVLCKERMAAVLLLMQPLLGMPCSGSGGSGVHPDSPTLVLFSFDRVWAIPCIAGELCLHHILYWCVCPGSMSSDCMEPPGISSAFWQLTS